MTSHVGGDTVFRDELVSMSACEDALAWVGARTLEVAWSECTKGDWLLWYAGRSGVDRRLIISAACACVRAALLPDDEGGLIGTVEQVSLRAIETVESRVRGEATNEQVWAMAGPAIEARRRAWEIYADASNEAARYGATHKQIRAELSSPWEQYSVARAATRLLNAALWAGELEMDWADEVVAAVEGVESGTRSSCADLVRKLVPCPASRSGKPGEGILVREVV